MKKLCDYFRDPAHLAVLLLAASIGALAFALTMQYGFNKWPCHLCYLQRAPYKFAIVLSVLSFIAAKKAPRFALPFLLMTGLCFVAGMGISGFHFGTEMKWWPLLDGCGGEGAVPDPSLSMQELMDYFKDHPIVRCDVPCCVFLGLSMTGWNFLYSTALAAFTFFHAIKGRTYGQKA